MDLDSAAQELQAHGFVILPGFVPAAELKPAAYPSSPSSAIRSAGRLTMIMWSVSISR